MNCIKCENLSLSFGKQKIFSDFCAEFEIGSVTALCAPSGVGKSTLLYLIAGLQKADSGRILSPYDTSDISFVFQEDRLFPWLCVLDNAAVNTDKEAAKRILTALGFSVEDFYKYPDEISGGMRRRVAIARALLHPADVYLLDEPFTGLDEDLHQRVANLVFERLRGKTVIFATHDAKDIEAYASKTIRL